MLDCEGIQADSIKGKMSILEIDKATEERLREEYITDIMKLTLWEIFKKRGIIK